MKFKARVGVRFALAASIAVLTAAGAHAADPGAPKGRALGFIAWDFTYAAYGGDKESCPDGLNVSAQDLFLAELSPDERVRIQKAENAKELNQRIGTRGNLNACTNPTEFKNPGLKIYKGKTHLGLNLDGADSTTPRTAPPNTCAHEDFVSPTGERGVDNQLGRVVGCIRGYLPGYDFDKYSLATLATGEHSVLIELRNVHDLRNDPDVEVGIYSGKPPIASDPNGKLLPYQSVSLNDDTHYHNETRGKIVDGVLTTEPIHLHLRIDQQVIHSEYDLKDARLRVELLPDGGLKGIVGGYFDIERRYEHVIHAGVITSRLLAYNCPGLYAAMHEYADGYPDPKTGKCTAISTAMRLQAIPAFIIHPDAKQASGEPAKPGQGGE